MNISICIPTYNRANHLANCLNSIISCSLFSNIDFQVCISDNCSSDETEEVVRQAQSTLNIKYKRNSENLGIPRNFISAVSMASCEFVWLIGDDDLLMPYALDKVSKLIKGHPNVDFFYVNSYHLSAEYLKDFPTPFDTLNLPSNMTPFSSWDIEGEIPFLKLIDPKISFDFLGGMYLSVFRRKKWVENTNVLDEKWICDPRIFSHFDNTFPHIKIFAKSFKNSTAYFNKKPLNVCLSGAREWAGMNSLIMSVRLLEALEEYRNNGLSYFKYIHCKNYALRNFASDFLKIIINKDSSGYSYINPISLLLKVFLYPNFYLSLFYFFTRRIKILIKKKFNISNSRGFL